MRSLAILALLMIANTAFAQPKVDVEQFQAITAKAARIEPMTDSVAVMLVERTPGVKTGASLTISSEYKHSAPYIDKPGVTITQSQVDPKRWLMFAPTGKYRLLVVESDPERGLKFNNVEVEIGTAPPDDNPPPDDPPPSGNLDSLTKVAKETADRLNDPPTRAALAKGYAAVVPLLQGKTYAEAMENVQRARRMILQPAMRNNPVVWNDWLKAVDAEMSKVVPAGDADKYRAAIEAIIKGLNGG